MRNTGLEEIQAGIKIAGKNNNNLRYADDTTLIVSREAKDSALLSSRDAGLLEPPERPQSAYLRLLLFLPAILIPAGASSSPAFLMMYSA